MGKPIIEEYNPAYYIFPKNTQFTFGLDKYLDHDFIHAEEHSNRKMEEILKTDYFKYFDEAFYDDDYLKIMNEQIQRHGIFAWIYLDKIIHPVFLRKASNVSLDAAKFSSLYKQAFPNRVPIHAKSMEECLGTIEGEIRSKTILLSRKIKKNVSSLRKWFEENKNIVRCEICSEQYRMIDLPYWIYYGSNALKGCCYRCRIMESPSKDELQRLIPEFVTLCGFIPKADTNLRNHDFTSRIAHDRWRDIYLSYGRMGGVEYVKKRFGSWFKGLATTGCLPDNVLLTGRGIKCISKDGHECNSLDEQRIDDWLTDYGIEHEKEPHYPQHHELNPKETLRADWRVGDILIEYFGLTGEEEYDRRVFNKLRLSKETGIKLIEVYPENLQNLKEKFHSLLEHP